MLQEQGAFQRDTAKEMLSNQSQLLSLFATLVRDTRRERRKKEKKKSSKRREKKSKREKKSSKRNKRE